MQQKSFDSKASIESYSEDLHDGFRIKYPDGGPTTSELFKHFIGQALLPGVTCMICHPCSCGHCYKGTSLKLSLPSPALFLRRGA